MQKPDYGLVSDHRVVEHPAGDDHDEQRKHKTHAFGVDVVRDTRTERCQK